MRAVSLALAPVAVAGAMLGSSRTLVSWDGFRHVGIAEHLALGSLPPENPFFAGEPLQGGWLHQALAAVLARALAIDPLHALAGIALASLALLMLSALHLGARRFGSAGAGLLIGWLAIAGLNPAGPAIAAVKAVREGIPLFEFPPAPVETVFVSNESADLFMAHPLLGAQYVSADWRRGQNLPWFFDNSSRGPALALLVPLMALGFARPSRRRLAGSLALGLACSALNPLVGLAGTAALLGGTCLVVATRRSRHAGRLLRTEPAADGRSAATGLGATGAAFLGAILAAPRDPQPFGYAAAGPAPLHVGAAFLPEAASVAVVFCVLAPLACYGAWRAPGGLRPQLVAIAAAGLALVAAVPALGLADGSESVLASAACVLLAVPALGFAARGGLQPQAASALVALFLPVTLCTLAAFAGRPPLPIASAHGVLLRVPADDPLAQLYAWIRRDTPSDAVFVVDSAHAVKMAANVSELPAFTGRALFVDQPSALTTPNATFGARRRLAADLTAGEPLAQTDAGPIRALARPVYLLSHAGDDEHLAEELTRYYGPPLFASGFVAVYPLAGAR